MGNVLHDLRFFEPTLLWRKLRFSGDSAQPCLAVHEIREIPHPNCIHRATCAVQGMESMTFNGRTRVQLLHQAAAKGRNSLMHPSQRLSWTRLTLDEGLLGQGICQALFAPGISCLVFFPVLIN